MERNLSKFMQFPYYRNFAIVAALGYTLRVFIIVGLERI
jgi:hypothetical protein